MHIVSPYCLPWILQIAVHTLTPSDPAVSPAREEVVTIIALLSADVILLTPPSSRQAALAAQQKFIAPEGDMVTLLNVFRAYRKVQKNKVGEGIHSDNMAARFHVFLWVQYFIFANRLLYLFVSFLLSRHFSYVVRSPVRFTSLGTHDQETPQ